MMSRRHVDSNVTQLHFPCPDSAVHIYPFWDTPSPSLCLWAPRLSIFQLNIFSSNFLVTLLFSSRHKFSLHLPTLTSTSCHDQLQLLNYFFSFALTRIDQVINISDLKKIARRCLDVTIFKREIIKISYFQFNWSIDL